MKIILLISIGLLAFAQSKEVSKTEFFHCPGEWILKVIYIYIYIYRLNFHKPIVSQIQLCSERMWSNILWVDSAKGRD